MQRRTENEKNRRRDLLAALRSRREQMLQALKRDQQLSSSRAALLDSNSGGGSSAYAAQQPLARETDTTAEMDNRGLVSLQKQIMGQQDTELEHLEKSVATTKHVALQINEETTLQNRLLDELDVEVGGTQDRLQAAQRKLKAVMRQTGMGCKTQMLMCMLLAVLVFVFLIAFKIFLK